MNCLPVLGSAHVLVASLKCRGIPKSLTGAIHFPRKIGAMGEIESSSADEFIFLPQKKWIFGLQGLRTDYNKLILCS